MMIETVIDDARYTSAYGSEVTAYLVVIDRRTHTDYEVRVINRHSIIFEKLVPMVFGTERAAKSYMTDIRAGFARPVR